MYKPLITKGYFQFEIIINCLVSYEYLCYESTAIINIFTLTMRGSILDVGILRLHTSIPRAVRVKTRLKLRKKFDLNNLYIP